MKQVYRIDNQGFFIEPVILGETDKLPNHCVEVIPRQGLYKAKYENGVWIEGLSQDEIDVIEKVPQLESELEKLMKQQELMQKAIDDMIMGGLL